MNRARAVTLTALIVATAAAFAQPPAELARECSEHLRVAQEQHRAINGAYADDTLELMPVIDALNAACFNGDVQFARDDPLGLIGFGDGLVDASADGYRAYAWHRHGDVLYLVTESGVADQDATTQAAATDPSSIDAETSTPSDVAAEESVTGATAEPLPEVQPAAAPEPAGDESVEVITVDAVDLAEVVRRADELLAAYDLEAAQAEYLALIQEDYRNTFAHDGLARARFLAGNLEEAATTLQVAARIAPENFRFQFNLGIILHLLERHQEAAAAFSAAVAIGADDDVMRAEALTGLGLSQMRAGQFATAVTNLKEAVTADPNADREYLALTARYRAGEGAELLPDTLDAAQRTGDYRFDLLAGRIYRDLRDFTSSDNRLDRAEARAEGDQERAQVLMQRAAMLIDAGGTPKLLLGQARDLDPSLWQASYNLGVLALQEHQYPLAIMHLTEAHSYSRSPTVAAALALAYLNDRQYEQALAYTQDALDAGEVDTALTAAFAAYHLGDYPAANAYLGRVNLAEQPVSVRALAGAIQYQLRDYGGAVSHFEAAYRQSSTLDLRRNLVNALLATARFQEAAVHLRDMTRNHPNDGLLHQQLGWAEHMLGNTLEAQLAFRRATALGAPLDAAQ